MSLYIKDMITYYNNSPIDYLQIHCNSKQRRGKIHYTYPYSESKIQTKSQRD